MSPALSLGTEIPLLWIAASMVGALFHIAAAKSIRLSCRPILPRSGPTMPASP